MKNFIDQLDGAVAAVATQKSMSLLCVKPGLYLLVVGGKRTDIQFTQGMIWSGGAKAPIHFIKDTEFEPAVQEEGFLVSVDLKKTEILISLKGAQFSTTAMRGAVVIDRAVIIGGSDKAAIAVHYDCRLPKPFSYQLVRGKADAERLSHQGLWHMIDHDPESLPDEWPLDERNDDEDEWA